MDNFDLKKFLIENRLTTNSKTLSEQVDELKVPAAVRNAFAGAAMLTGVGAQAQTPNQAPTQQQTSHQVDIQKLATNQPTAKGQKTQDVRVQSYTKVIEQAIAKGSKSQASNIVVQVTKITETNSGKIDVLYEVSGNILASSQEDANAKAMSMVKDALGEANISIAGLTTIMEAQRLFPFKLQLKAQINK